LSESVTMPARDHSANGTWASNALTSRLEFEKTADWTHAKVLDWAAQHLGFRDLGRTICLETSYRAGAWLSELLFSAGGAAPGQAATPVIIVPVPPLRPLDGRGKRPKGPPPLPKEGAGLEQDLAVARHGDRLPTELRPHLPSRGIVNFLEAQAVVRKLERLVGPPARVDAAPKPAPVAAIAVIAFSQAQVELLRLLMRRSLVLKGMLGAVEVGTPAAFAQREFATVLVSFTRSHNHRAVALAESFGQLVTALTRARGQIILFADPGTLVRRSQCPGRIEHLDDAASAREAQFAAELVRCLQGQTSHIHDVVVES
jgi:hypothetical protein